MPLRSLLIIVAVLSCFAATATAQIVQSAVPPRSDSSSPARASARWPADGWIHRRTVLEFDLTQPLASHDRVGLIVNDVDVSAFVEISGTRVRVQPAGWALPAGESAAVLSVVDSTGRWHELLSAPIRVLTSGGFERATVAPSAELASTGQLDQSASAREGISPPRRRYQDLTLRMGVTNEVTRRGWRASVQANAIGVSQETQRLRWSQLQSAAPVVDLSDYRVQIARGAHQVALGNVTASGHRFLMNGMSSRGVTAVTTLGPRVSMTGALVNGSDVVGWSNLGGIGTPQHRIASGTLSMDLIPERAGALNVAVSLLDGSLLPRDGYSSSTVTDAESSRGWGAQLSARDARERIRVSAGFARSRFLNPADALLMGDTTVVPVEPRTRGARYGELALQLPAEQKIAGRVPVALSATVRHERVDPLYRSVGGSVGADIAQDGLDVAGRIGAMGLHLAAANSRDNLANIPSLLTTRTASRSVRGDINIAELTGTSSRWFLPTMQYAVQHTHQYGTGVPLNAEFSATHVPDQVSTVRSATANWSASAWNIAYRWNGSFQDNRQTGREKADFRGDAHSLSLGTTVLRQATASVEASIEQQSTLESGLTQRTARIGASSEVRIVGTTLSTAIARARATDPFANRRSHDTEYRIELARGFDLYRRRTGATQGRTFLRYARTLATLVTPSDATIADRRLVWTLSAGGSLRLY